MYSLCFCFKLLNVIFIKGREHTYKNIQLCILICYKKLSRLLKVTAGQVSMCTRLEHISVCNVSVSEVKEFHLLWCQLFIFPWFSPYTCQGKFYPGFYFSFTWMGKKNVKSVWIIIIFVVWILISEREYVRQFPVYPFPNVTAFSPFSSLKPLSGVQLTVWAGLALPKGKLGSCLSSLIYEALKGTADQKYLHHWPAISAKIPMIRIAH